MNFGINDFPNKGFTLIELLVVVAIIGLLSSIVFSSLNIARIKGRDAKRVADLAQIRNALELFYDDNGYYPQSSCGWDCNGYRNSYTSSSWNLLAADLAPYLSPLPKDPVNSACSPWNDNCFSYTYGNVTRYVYKPQYDLTGQMEDPNSPLRCEVRLWRFLWTGQVWCPTYSIHVYEASL